MIGQARSALLSSASLVGILAGALLGLTASEARSACAESSGVWTCTGVETTSQGLERSGSTLDVSLDSGFDMDAAEGVAFTLGQSGAGGIVFVQAAGGQEIVGHTGVVHATNSGAGDISITATGALRRTDDGVRTSNTAIVSAVQADASGGSVTIRVGALTGASGIGGGGHGVMVRNAGTGATAITASGAIDTGTESGDGVNVVDGTATSQKAGAVTVSVATVTGWGSGIRIVHRRGGNVSVRATGTVRGGNAKNNYSAGFGRNHAISVTNADQDSDISVAAAAVTALGSSTDGIHVSQQHGGTVAISASGAVSSAGRHGIFVDQQGDGSVSISVSGSVTGGGGGSDGDGDAAIKVAAGDGNAVTIILESGAVVGRAGKAGIIESSAAALIEVKAGAELKGGAWLGDGDDTLNLRGGAVSGDVHFGDGDDTVNLYGGTIANVDLGDGSDTVNFQRGVSTVNGGLKGAPSLHFRSGAVARIVNSRLIDWNSSVNIASGAIAILDGLGRRKTLGGGYGGITVEGTLNTADGVMGDADHHSWLSWAVIRTSRTHSTAGTWIMDADFDRGRGDGISWNWHGRDKTDSVMTIEPAMLSSGYLKTAPAGDIGTTFKLSVPEAFVINQSKFPYLIRQILRDGTCASGGNGAFTCTNLFWEQQNLSASGTDRLDVVLGSTTTVVHALAGTRNGLLLAQTGSGGISLRQTSGRHRIAAAGHAIHASASGTGAITIQVDGAVIGGLTGRVIDADGIAAAAAGGAVSVSASSVTGLRHGITASAGGSGGVEVEARGAVAGQFGNGVYATAAGGSVTVTAEAVAGGQVGILARAAGPVSISVSGPVTGGDGDGDAAIKVEAGENAVRISLESGAVVGHEGSVGIVASSGSDLVEVKAGAEAKGDIRLGDGDDVVNLHGVAVAGVDLGRGSDTLNFERGFSTVNGDINGSPSLHFKSGAVARIANSRLIDSGSGVNIGSGAIAILDALGWRKHLGGKYGGITIEGTLNTADGVMGFETLNSWPAWMVIGIYRVHGTTGTWVFDADFDRGRADSLSWSSVGYQQAGAVLTLEPALLSAKQGGSAVLGSTITEFRSSVPEAFSIYEPGGGIPYAIRQTLPGGTCTSGGSGAFTCTNLIWEQQTLSASGTDRLDVVLGSTTTVVHALAGTRRGLSLAQTGSGGISLRQTSGKHRIAAAGHAIHASASGTGAVSIQVDGAVIGGLTGRVPDADGIAAAAAGGAVSIAAGSVTGLRHGITARAGGSGGVQVRASGAVIGQFGHGVHAEAPGGGVTVAAASVSGGQTGILASAAGPVSISVSGSVTGGGDAVIKVVSSGTALLEVNAGARVNGDVRLGGGSGALTLRGGAISGDVHFGDGDDAVNIHGGTVVDINLGGGSHALTFHRGVSEVSGGVNGTARIEFKSGAVARIANSRSIGWHSGMDIEKGAIAILNGHGWKKHLGGKYGGITVEGTLNTADGTVGDGIGNALSSWMALAVHAVHGTTGTWVLDADFYRSRADALGWNLHGSPPSGSVLTVEPAMLSARQWSSAPLGNTTTKFISGVPEAFSIEPGGHSSLYAVRQTMPNGTCTGGGSGAFTCTSLIWEEQNLSASGSTTLDVELGPTATVVHALAGTRRGLSLEQTGSGGISLKQSSGGHRIAAAGDAIRASASGTGAVSIQVNGNVIGGLTGRVPDADGISAATAEGPVRVAAGSVTGLRHGIAAVAGGPGSVAVEARGAVSGQFGSGVYAKASDGGVTISAATAAGGEAGILARAAGRVSISVSGQVTGGDAAIKVEAGEDAPVRISLESGAVVGSAGEAGILARAAGPISISVSGQVTGGDAAIKLEAGEDAPVKISLESGAVVGSAGEAGILARAAGPISISVSGQVTGGDAAIKLEAGEDAPVKISLESGAVVGSAGKAGILARAAGPISISVSGQVTGGDAAIKLEAGEGADVRISLESGAVVGRLGKAGIVGSGGNAWIEVKTGAQLNGDVRLGDRPNTLNVRGGTVSGKIHLGRGNDVLALHGGTFSDIDLGHGSDTLKFERGLSTVKGNINGVPSLHFKSGSVTRIGNSKLVDWKSSINIESGAIAILDGLGWRKYLGGKYGGITIEGTLSTADGVMGSETGNSWPWWAVTRIYRVRGTTGTWVLDADFDRGRADALEWNLHGNNTESGAVLTVEPAMISSKHGSTVILGDTYTKFRSSVPEAFSIDQEGLPYTIRQILPSGTCASGGSGAFTCTSLIWEQQNLSASGTDRLDVVLGSTTTVVHALNGTRNGLLLAQTGSGGISLKQTSGRHRIAAAGHAIQASASGTGSVDISVDGAVIGGLTGRVPEADGIVADAAGGAVSVTASSVTGLRHGIAASGGGSGGVDVAASGTVIGWFGKGISAAASGGDATVSAATVTGGEAGIMVSGTGAVSIQVSGRVQANDHERGAGIHGVASGTGALSITAADVKGAAFGVHAVSHGSGPVSVKAGGVAATGAEGVAIRGVSSGTGALSITAADVKGVAFGVHAVSHGSGPVSVKVGGVEAAGAEGVAIRGVSSGTGSLSITAANVKGAAFGVHAVSHGSGPVSVKAGGVEATGERGVAVRGVSSGTGPLSIKVANVTGRVFGVDALSRGSGAVSVQAGYVRATSFGGMAVQGVSSGTGALSIKVAGVRGRDFGIRAVGKGSGSVSVVADGNVTSLNGPGRHGVHARASGAGSLTVSVGGNLSGGETAVKAVGGGGGDVFVTTFRSVTGLGNRLAAGAAGIYAIAQGGDIVISASGASRNDKVYGAGAGIRAVSSGTGSVSISTSLNVLGDNGPGIHVVRSKAGDVAISVSKGVLGFYFPAMDRTPTAIRTQSPSGSSISISLDSGTHVAMSGKDAVVGSDGNTSMTVNSGARLDGRVRLGAGDDALVFDGGPFSGVEEMDGGAGADTLTFRRGSGALHASVVSKGLKGWETIVVESGASISGDVRLAGDSGSLRFIGAGVPLGDLDGGSGSANTLEFQNVGTATLPSSSDLTGWETIRIGAGSNIAFGGQNRVVAVGTLALSSGGTLDVGKDGDTSDRLTVSGDFAGGGAITLNANFMPDEGASDRLTITGNATGWTTVDISKVGENRSVSDSDRPTRINGVIKVQGSVAAHAFSFSSGGDFVGVLYQLEFDAPNSEFDLVRLCFPFGPSSCVDPSGAGGASGLAASQPSGAGIAGGAAPMAMSAPVAMALAAPQSEPAAAGLAGAFVPACLETRPGSGAFSCGGARIGSPQRLGATGATALSVKLAPQTEVDTDGTAFSLTQSGTGGIAFERKEGGAAIRAKGDAIAARNAGGGFVSISAGGAIAAGGDGVSAISDARGEGVRIDVATVAAGGDGVSVEAAAGGVSVTADDAKGRGAGIRVRTGDGGTGVEISAGSAEGGVDGISVDHGGGGEVRITTTGAVSGARGDGVHARSEAGHVSVRVSGEVSGGAAAGGAAIRTDGASAAVTLESGASVRATGGGAAVMDGAGAALVTVREGASILGGVSLGAGADELVLAGGDFGGITALDGGPGRDALRIEAGRGSLPALSNGAVSGVESVIVTGDAWIEGDLLLAEDAGELVFADGARIDGHGRLDGGGGASLSLRGVSGEMDAARLSGWTSLEIGEGSRVTLAGAGLGRDAAESLSVAGTMAFGSDARAGDAFTVEGDFEGGGRVEIDADLAAGSADRLVIEGDVSGTTEIALRDLTPSGAEPSGAEMAVVSVGGEADASAFRLAGGAVARGAFLYDLRMAPEGGVFSLVADGGVSDTGAALRSSDAAIARGLARAATLQARAAARAVASVWARIGSAATFAERGAALAGRDAVDLSARKTRPVWMRLHGDRWDYGAGGAAMIDSSGFEVGMDLLSRESSGGKWIAGLTAQYGTVGAEAAAGGGVGRQGASGYGVGATLSWLGYGGFYADAQAQAGMSDSDFSSDTGGAIRSGVSARTAVAALELGWRVAASDSATIVPQAQISMSGVSGDGFVSGSLDVAESSAASFDGRIGLAAEIALREGYLRFSGSLLRALSELDGTVINGRTVAHGLPDGWAEFAVGGSLDLSEDRVLFLDGTWRTGLGGGGGDAGGASISGGLKVNW